MFAFSQGKSNLQREEWRRALWSAWQTANFQRAKKLPDLKRLLDKLGKRKKARQSVNQMVAMARMLNKQFGGKEVKRDKDKDHG